MKKKELDERIKHRKQKQGKEGKEGIEGEKPLACIIVIKITDSARE